MKMRSQTFIRAGAADLERVLAFIKAYYDFDGIPFKASQIKRGLHALLENSSLGQVWLIHRNAQDVGYAVITFGYDLEFGGRLATITELYIAAPTGGSAWAPKQSASSRRPAASRASKPWSCRSNATTRKHGPFTASSGLPPTIVFR